MGAGGYDQVVRKGRLGRNRSRNFGKQLKKYTTRRGEKACLVVVVPDFAVQDFAVPDFAVPVFALQDSQCQFLQCMICSLSLDCDNEV